MTSITGNAQPFDLHATILKRGDIPGKTLETVRQSFPASLAPTDTFTERRVTYSVCAKTNTGGQVPFWLKPSDAPGYDAFMRGIFECENGSWVEHGCKVTRG